MNECTLTSAAALNEKLSAARLYAQAQQALLQVIVDERPAHVIAHGLDVARTTAAMLATTNPMASSAEGDPSAQFIQDTAELLGLLEAIKQAEALIIEWLQMPDRGYVSPVMQHLEQTLGLEADPRHDIFVAAGTHAAAIATELQSRQYARVLQWSGLCSTQDPSILDVSRVDLALEAIPELSQCRPRRLWLLWGPEASCPDAFKALFDERLRKVFMNRNTAGSLGERWAQQFIANIPALSQRGRVLTGLRDAFAGCGAVIVGAGPSLDESVTWIREQAIRPVVIASYKAVKALARGGVTPDFIVMLDPKQGAHHLEGLDLCGVAAIVTEVAVDPASLGKSEIPILPYCANDDTRTLVSTLGDIDVPMIRSGGSVSHVALQFARVLGCSRITLAGADFGFPGDRLYAAGAGEGDELRFAEDRRSYVRRAVDGNGRSGLLVGALANDGGVIATTIELDHYRGWTEEFIRECRRSGLEIEFFNLSGTGARIEGAPLVTDLAKHRAARLTMNTQQVVAGLLPLLPAANSAVTFASRLREKTQKLRELSRTCITAVAAARSGKAGDLKAYNRVAEQAGDCPEVSLILTRRLQVIDEQARRSTVDVPERLRELAMITGEEADRVAGLYSSVLEKLQERERFQVA
jgi:hypothetical protein